MKIKNENSILFGKHRYMLALFACVSFVTFTSCSTDSKPVYKLTTNSSPAEGGSITPTQGEYDKGTEVQVTASANEHWVFTGWGGDHSGTSNPATVMMDSDKSLSALFEKKQYALTVNIEGEGEVEERLVNAKSTDYPAESVVELTAVPAENWEFERWEGDLTGSENPETVTVVSETNIIAVFEEIIEVSVEGNGSVEIEFLDEGEKRKAATRRAKLTAVPDEEHYFAQWGGDIEGIENPTIVEFEENMQVDASFVDGPFFLDANGVTVRCHDASVGEKGTVNGVEYEAVDRDLLIHRRDGGADLSRVCTSAVTDMRDMFYNPDSYNSVLEENKKIMASEEFGAIDDKLDHMPSIQEMLAPNQFRSSGNRLKSRTISFSNSGFNQDISSWDVSNVTDMFAMFSGATEFNQDISSWDVSSVTDMSFMFQLAESFNQNIGNWDVSNVEHMTAMFALTNSFNQNIGSWDVSNVLTMDGMFWESPFNRNIGNWDVSRVENMAFMFFDNTSFNQNIGGWNVSSVVQMYGIFGGASSFNQNIGSWNVSNVTNMGWMFRFAESFNQDIGSWDVGNVIVMTSMFKESPFNKDIGDWDVGNVEFMVAMFAQNPNFNQDISNWDVSSVTNMRWMFNGAESFNHNIGGWNVGSVEDLGWMFQGAESFNRNIGDWDVSSATAMDWMFGDAVSFNQNLTGWCVSNFSEEPEEFATDSPLSEENKPIWGTCP